MDSETGLIGSFGPGKVAPFLLGGAAFFVLLSFFVGWFSVDTSFDSWFYDPGADDGKGEKIPYVLKIDTEMKPLSMGTSITPKSVQEGLTQEGEVGLPTYEDHAPRTGTQFLGIFVLLALELLVVLVAIGFYFWNLRARRNFGPTIWKLSALYAGVFLFMVGLLIFAVPHAAEQDTREILSTYHDDIRAQPGGGQLPNIKNDFPEMLEPNVSFVWTWTCCPVNPDSPNPNRDASVFNVQGNQILVLMTTKSRPSTGFWLQSVGLVSFFVGLAFAARARQLTERRVYESQPPPPPPPIISMPPISR